MSALAPWPVGIDMVSDLTALTKGAARDVVNGVIIRSGAFEQRPGESQLTTQHMNSGYTALDGTAYVQTASTLNTINADLSLTELMALPDDTHISYVELNDDLFFSSLSVLGIIENGVARTLGVELTGGWFASSFQSGGLFGGSYGVALSYNGADGEGGLSDVQFVNVPNGGGIKIALPTPIGSVTGINIYRTEAGGSDLYFAETVPVMGQYIIGVGAVSTKATTQFLGPMQPGRFLAHQNGRLLSARGRTLYVSEPMRYGLTDLRTGFVQFQAEIAFVIAFTSGVFVGTKKGTFFLNGASPKDWTLAIIDPEPPLFGSGISVNVETFSDDEKLFPAGTNFVAAWLGSGGFHFGLPSGSVVRPQNDRIELDLSGMKGSLQLVGNVLTAIVH